MVIDESTSSQDSVYEKFKKALKTLHENNIIHGDIKLENLGLKDKNPIFLNFESSQIFDNNYQMAINRKIVEKYPNYNFELFQIFHDNNQYFRDNDIVKNHPIYKIYLLNLTDIENLAIVFDDYETKKIIEKKLARYGKHLISNRTGKQMSLKLPQHMNLNTNFNSSSL